jgi:hypothetical protein
MSFKKNAVPTVGEVYQHYGPNDYLVVVEELRPQDRVLVKVLPAGESRLLTIPRLQKEFRKVPALQVDPK